jgi:hypothetical protein
LPGFWLLKLNPDSFEFDNFKKGDSIWFGTHNTKFAERPEYNLFFEVQEGDKVIGYALGDHKSVIWRLEITTSVNSHPSFGENIELKIIDLISPEISIEDFAHKIPPELYTELTGNSPRRLVPLDAKLYESILGTKGRERNEDDLYEENVDLLNDNISTEDLLGRTSFVNALADYVERLWMSQPKEAYTIHLSGEWGSGKSNILSFLEKRLETERQIKNGKRTEKIKEWLVIRHNAWENQHINPPWWVLLDNIYRGILKKESSYKRVLIWCKEQWWRAVTVNRLYWLAFMIFSIAAWLLIWHFNLLAIWTTKSTSTNQADTLKAIVTLFSILGTVWIIFKGIGRSLIPGSSEAALNFQKSIRDPMETVKKHFEEVIRYTNRHVVILIDDIDRCNPESTVRLLEGIQTLFKSTKVLYFISGDGAWIKQCFDLHYGKFREAIEKPGYKLGDFFLEKIFQMNINVPFISETVIKRFWKVLVNGSSQTMDEKVQNEEENKLNRARQDLKGKTTEKAIDEIINSKAGGSDEIYYRQAAVEQISNVQVLRNIKHRLEDYTDFLPPNPRALKRLVNNYALSRQSLILQGISLNSVSADSLVRWLILSSKFPQFAERISKTPEEIQNNEFTKVKGFSELVVNHLDQGIVKSIIGK